MDSSLNKLIDHHYILKNLLSFDTTSYKSNINAINYIEAEGELANNDLCLYDLCEEYIFNYDNSYECDSSQSDAVYQVGDQLRCEDVLDDLDLCFPNNCGETFNFSKVYGKVIWLELTASW